MSTIESRSGLRCLVLGFAADDESIGRGVRLALEAAGVAGYTARKLLEPVKTRSSAQSEVTDAHFVVAEISNLDPVVAYYLGLAAAMDKPTVMLRRFEASDAAHVARQADFDIVYEADPAGREELGLKFQQALRTILRTDSLDHGVLLGQRDMELDWRQLGPAQHESLCFELLLRDGFVGVTWVDDAQEIDILARRHLASERTGSDLAEPYLVAIGSGLDDATTATLLARDIELLSPRVASLVENGTIRAGGDGKVDLNLLFIWSPHHTGADDDFSLRTPLLSKVGQAAVRAFHRHGVTIRPRVGFWDRDRLTSLVRRQPMLLRRYFADDDVPDTRQDLEQLYRVAARLAQRAARASNDLELRYGHEPALEWQQRAYSVTHSIGNAIFPVETYAELIEEIFEENGDAEGAELARRALENLEKAKIHIRKFKHIARLKKPALGRVDALPHLERSLAVVGHRGIRIERYFDEHLPTVRADPDLFDEAIDELVANACSWLERADEPQLTVTARRATPADLPPRLEGSPHNFAWIRLEDSGPGVENELKEKIFELFFSTNPTGMGFGLATVRHNMRDFGGEIVETGVAGAGARFDLFLPIA